MTNTEPFADQKPRKGDPITYRGKFAGTVSSVQGNLCYLDVPVEGWGKQGDPFIWRFNRTSINAPRLNNLHDWPTKRDMRWDEGEGVAGRAAALEKRRNQANG